MTLLWMFTGQGSLVPGAAKGLYEANAVFRDALDRYAAVLESKVEVPLLKLLLSDEKDVAELVQETQYAQPAIVALQLAQVAMWRARGMRPAVVLGHSVGELAAAMVAGVSCALTTAAAATGGGRRCRTSSTSSATARRGNELMLKTSGSIATIVGSPTGRPSESRR